MPTKSEETGKTEGQSVADLVKIMETLLSPGGCPWDREQSVESLVPYMIEECYEVVDAIENHGAKEHCEELGDVLLQIVFHSALRKREGAFTIDDVVAGIVAKMVRRHPHVFSDTKGIDSAENVVEQWEDIKAREKGLAPDSSALGEVPLALAPLARAHKLSKRAAKVGFDWPDPAGCRAKVLEELEEVSQAETLEEREEELGDLLFACASLARKYGVLPSTALRRANTKFETRFREMEKALAAKGKKLKQLSLAAMESEWQEVKRG